MKYLILGLFIVLTVTSRPTGATADPMTYDSVVTLVQEVAGVMATEVTIHLQKHPGVTVLALSVRQFDEHCGPGSACGEETLFAGSVTQRIPAADAVVDRQLAWGSLHTRVAVFDTISNTNEDVALDVEWTATDGLAPVPHGIGQAFYRDAAARGVVTSRALGTVALQSTDPGTLARHIGD